MNENQIKKAEALLILMDGFLKKKRYDGRIEDLRGCFKALKPHVCNLIVEVQTPWWIKIFRR